MLYSRLYLPWPSLQLLSVTYTIHNCQWQNSQWLAHLPTYPTSATRYFSHHFVEKGNLSYHTTRSTNEEIREREYTHTPQDAIEPFPLAVLVLRHRRGRAGHRRLELQRGEGGEVPHPLPHPAQSSGVIPSPVDVVGVGPGVGREGPLALPVPIIPCPIDARVPCARQRCIEKKQMGVRRKNERHCRGGGEGGARRERKKYATGEKKK